MKKLLTWSLAAILLTPVYSLAAKQTAVSGSFEKTILVAANDQAELQPAESEKKAEATGEDAVEEKKDSKAGFFAGVALMIAFVIVILLKTKKMTDD
jgi:hypothetical protein